MFPPSLDSWWFPGLGGALDLFFANFIRFSPVSRHAPISPKKIRVTPICTKSRDQIVHPEWLCTQRQKSTEQTTGRCRDMRHIRENMGTRASIRGIRQDFLPDLFLKYLAEPPEPVGQTSRPTLPNES